MHFDLDAFLRSAIAEDVGDGDRTTEALVPPERRARGALKLRDAGVIAGLHAALLAACWLCCCSELTTSLGVNPRACSFSGSSQIRMEYWPAPNTLTLPTPGSRESSSLRRMVA